MPSYFAAIWAIVRKDIAAEWRSRRLRAAYLYALERANA